MIKDDKEIIDLFNVDPYLTLIVSGSSNNISEPGKSKKFILLINTTFSEVSNSLVCNNSNVNTPAAFADNYPNSLAAPFLFLTPNATNSPIYALLFTFIHVEFYIDGPSQIDSTIWQVSYKFFPGLPNKSYTSSSKTSMNLHFTW